MQCESEKPSSGASTHIHEQKETRTAWGKLSSCRRSVHFTKGRNINDAPQTLCLKAKRTKKKKKNVQMLAVKHEPKIHFLSSDSTINISPIFGTV